jgi:predicted permease
MNGQAYVIVGVLPGWFQFPRDAELWTPLAFTPEQMNENNRGSHGLQAIARIRPEMGVEQARSDMAAVSSRIIEQHPGYHYRDVNFAVIMVPLLEQEIGGIKLALWVLMGAVGLVLLIACANVANLLLVRASGREREIAVRQALGVGRGRLIRQLLTESAVLGLAGGAAGVLLAEAALRALIALSATTVGAASLPRVAEARIDLPVLLFTIAISLATGILFGLAPAFHATRHNPHEALKEGARGNASRRSQGLRGALVVAEMALSLTLMAGSGLLIRSFLQLQDVDSGFRSGGVLTMRVPLPVERYPKATQMHAFFRELVDRVRRLPGVDAAGMVSGLPLSGVGFSGTTTVDTQAVPPQEATPEADQRPATDGYFEAMGIGLVRGRFFDQRDTEDSAPVAIIDETMAKTYWPNQDAIGRRIRQGGMQSSLPWRTIVGVVRHVRYRTLESPSRVEFYWPYAQTNFPLGSMSLALHTGGDPRLLASAVEREVRAIDADQPVSHIRTMTELVSESMARRRLSMFLLAIFAGAALLLASVAQRSHEFGIRMALGASGFDVLRLVLGQGIGLVAIGILIGLAGSVFLTRLLSSLLFQVNPSDPVTFAAVACVLGLVAVTASFIPAYRATAIDPVNALRQG